MHIVFVYLSLAQGYINLPLQQKKSYQISNIETSNQVTKDIDLENYSYSQFYVYLEIGNPRQIASLLIDTGSPWTWVPNISCSNLNAERMFDSRQSSTYTSTNEAFTISYITGKVSGVVSQDTISYDKIMSHNQHFLLVNNTENMEWQVPDGHLGLSFSSGFPVFIDSLLTQGTIDSSIFSLFLGGTDDDSEPTLTIGGYDIHKILNPKRYRISIYSDKKSWTTNCTSFGYGNKKFSTSSNATFNTAINAIYMPYDSLTKIQSRISLYAECKFKTDLECKCKENDYSDFEEFRITVGGQELFVTPKDYMIYENEVCVPQFFLSQDNLWVLGLPIFKGYYAVHNMQEFYIDMYKQNESESQVTFSPWYIVVGILFIATISIFAYLCCKSRNHDEYTILKK